MILFFDTETTGKADFTAQPDASHQPRLVQLAALLTDNSGKEIASASVIVKPNGFFIPVQASSIHGFTTEIATELGFNLESVLPIFWQMARKAKVIVAHNIDFDALVIDGEFMRSEFGGTPFGRDAVMFCTMKGSTEICKLPGNYGSYKWPKLQEAYKHAFGQEFDGAHNALADVRACSRLYFWIIERTQPVKPDQT